MPDLTQRILQALGIGGLSPAQVADVARGAPIYGDAEVVDSLGLVRLVAAVSDSFGDLGIDMFELLVEQDLEATEAFASLARIEAFLAEALPEVAAE